MIDLAIVIPAYKKSFFDKALNSLLQQTNKNFTVYVGDDHSPFDLYSIVNNYTDKLNIHYTRFPNNIGSKDLVLHWARCISLTKNEKWIWLFSDDDIMDTNCVECFYQTIEQKKDAFDIFRFNTVTIDKNDHIIHHNPVGPEIESSEQMAYQLLKGNRGNSMPDHIFSRKVFDQYNGFVFTEYAQGADWALSILYSKEKGICIIPDAKIYWRNSGINISSKASSDKKNMINGHFQFIQWALDHFQYLKTTSSGITYEMIVEALRDNLKIVIINHYKGFGFRTILPLFRFYRKQLKLSYYNSLKILIEIKEYDFPVIQKAHRMFTRVKNKFQFSNTIN